MTRAILDSILHKLSRLMPRTRRLAVFGSWCGRQYSDNPKYLLEYLLEHSTCRCVWVGEPQVEALLPKHPRLKFARFGSFAANWAALRAKNWFFSQGAALDISPWSLFGGARLYNLWHGIPVKKMGRECPGWKGDERTDWPHRVWRWMFARIVRPATRCWLPVASDDMARLMGLFVPEMFSPERAVACGSPRNDWLIANRGNRTLIESLKEKYARLLGFDSRKKIVLYMPTFRGVGARVGLGDIVDGGDAVLIEKHHPLTFRARRFEGVKTNGSILVPPELCESMDTQELCLVADVMIGDYSSAYLDFALLGRPTVHYVYDLEEYATKDAGLAYDIRDVAGGPVVKTEAELKSAVRQLLAGDPFTVGRKLPELLEYEKGTACRQLQEHAGIR